MGSGVQASGIRLPGSGFRGWNFNLINFNNHLVRVVVVGLGERDGVRNNGPQRALDRLQGPNVSTTLLVEVDQVEVEAVRRTLRAASTSTNSGVSLIFQRLKFDQLQHSTRLVGPTDPYHTSDFNGIS
jgi:hypothetical protein